MDTVNNTFEKDLNAKPCAIEPYDKEWGVGASGMMEETSPFPRVNKILAKTQKTTNGVIVTDRALLVTETYKKYAGSPQIIKCAEGVSSMLRNVPIYVYEDELIVGNLGCDKKAAPVFPEFGLNWIVEEMEQGLMGYSDKRTHDYFTYSEQTQNELTGIKDFWKGQCIEDVAVPLLSDEELKGSHMGKGLFLAASYIYSGAGHLGINYEKLFKLGFGGIRKQIQEKMEQLDTSLPEDISKKAFYQAELIVCDAAIEYILRFSRRAQELAEVETEPIRKKELLQIAANCDWVSENPPCSFWEAIQLVHLATCIIEMESNGHSISYGRFDQYMYPYYLNDLRKGTATREFMQELLECFNIKIWDMNKVRDHVSINIFANGGIGGPALTVGGLRKDGLDGTNDLTFMVLDAIAHTRIPTPWLAVRLHGSTPWQLKVKLANVIRIGTGEPKIFNDDVTIPSMLNYGRSLEDCRDYQVVGCVEPDAPGKEYGWHDAAYFNIAKVLELAINNGQCLECGPSCPRFCQCAGAGMQLGIKTGSLGEFTSFDQVLNAFDQQMKYWCDKLVSVLNAVDIAHQAIKPLPYLSLLMDDCIDNGVDVTAGGAKYNFTGPQGVGIGTVGDGLATIKQLVFEEKKISGAELLEAAKKNWEGHEPLYALVNSEKVHHYGNDDDYADELTKLAMDTYCKYIEKRPNARGGVFQPGIYSVAVNVALGGLQWASIEGRKANEPISDCMGAVHTHRAAHDLNGPTAICKSVTKMDHGRAANGTLLNWKFSPTALSGQTGRDNLIALLDTYVQRKGMHSQFTVANRETLLKAQANPEEYKGLLVRVAGYSAYFVELSKELQDDIIGRSELSFD
ncbi:formate C-acetyltransferase/glycerol dehydratase family glycyl radical enzyme [Dehalobacter sp. DCM]|uniref:(2S)-3-sulfopropanediol dehydratase n=1 Tax=Dehalobacter sp. DCM TaxID=2907827 RepID=UPI0030818667|nr:formate C-acetyltransferase/glycerol dehydratase family glycyl radical enzyme [Dehalobacter sp. DCM]